jgi:redox-sensitive bicupin YhaK (pirin superfamily)
MGLVPGRRDIASIHNAFRTLEGDGFEVRRAIPSEHVDAVGPFIFLDHFGPIDVRPGEAKGASAHPHAGIETLTLLLEGSSVHKDSLGNISVMHPGEVQWLRAGRGVIHDESPDDAMRRAGGRMHGVQLWINMPKAAKHDAPAYRHVKATEIPVLASADGKTRTRLVAGQAGGAVGPIVTAGAPFVAHASVSADGKVEIETVDVNQLAVYVMVGTIVLGQRQVEAGQLARLSEGAVVRLAAASDAEVLLVGGAPLDAPIHRYGPFVMNSVADLQRAIRDYQAGRMGILTASQAA